MCLGSVILINKGFKGTIWVNYVLKELWALKSVLGKLNMFSYKAKIEVLLKSTLLIQKYDMIAILYFT